MLLDEKIQLLQKETKRKITYEEVADVLGLGSKQAAYNRVTRKTPLKDWEIVKLDSKFKNDEILPSDCITIDYYPQIFGSCGGGVFALSQEKQVINVPKSAFMFNYSENKTYSVINAWGDSMNPFIQNKDKLVVEHLNGEQIKDNHIYVFCYKDEIFVKRLIKNIDEMIIKSDNTDPIYRPRVIEGKKLNDLYIIGEIVGLVRNLK